MTQPTDERTGARLQQGIFVPLRSAENLHWLMELGARSLATDGIEVDPQTREDIDTFRDTSEALRAAVQRTVEEMAEGTKRRHEQAVSASGSDPEKHSGTLVTTSEAARLLASKGLHLSGRRLRQLIAGGSLAGVQVGRTWCVEQAVLNELIAERTKDEA